MNNLTLFISEYAAVILAVVILLVIAAYVAYLVYAKQTEKLQKWLLLAVVEAEKHLKSGTGRLKIEWVYDQFVLRFKYLHVILPRSTFEKMVDMALEELKELIAKSDDVAFYVNEPPTLSELARKYEFK